MCVWEMLLETEAGRKKKPQFTLLYREPFWRRRNGLLHATKSLLVKKVPKTAHCSCELLGDWLRSLKSENRKRKD